MSLRGNRVTLRSRGTSLINFTAQVGFPAHACGFVARHFVASLHLQCSLVVGWLTGPLLPSSHNTKRTNLMTKGQPQDPVSGGSLHSVFRNTREQWP